jgi:MFS family permease
MTAHDTETSPLLRTSTSNSRDDKLKLCVAARATVAISSLLLLFSIMIGGVILEVPRVEVLENILCRKRYPDAALGSNDPRCKEDDVQSDLSMLKAVEISCGLLPGLLTSVPWGVVADRYGRLFVLRLAMLGVVLCEGSNIVICMLINLFSLEY